MKNKIKNFKYNYNKNTIYLCNLSIPQAFELFDSDMIKSKYIFEMFVYCSLAILMMVQISISSKPESIIWIEQLESYKDIKKKFINNKVGLLVSACYGITFAQPYARYDIEKDNENIVIRYIDIAEELAQSYDTNTKRIKPSKDNWLLYARGEMGAVKGQMLSCPNTNLIKLNIDPNEILSYDIKIALEKIGFDKTLYDKYNLSIENIKCAMRNIFLTNNGGIPIDNLIYNEPNFVISKIQNEILSNNIIRMENANPRLEKGMEPISSLNIDTLKKHLTKSEFFAYNIAARTGDIKMLKSLTDIALVKSKNTK